MPPAAFLALLHAVVAIRHLWYIARRHKFFHGITMCTHRAHNGHMDTILALLLALVLALPLTLVLLLASPLAWAWAVALASIVSWSWLVSPTYSHALILMLSPCERVGHGRAVPWPLTLMKQRVQERVWCKWCS